MKMINKQGKVAGKIHIFDILILLVILLVGITAFERLTDNELISFSQEEDVKIKYEVVFTEYSQDYFTSVAVGDQLAEDKKYLDGKVTNILIEDRMITRVDNEGKAISAPDPIKKKVTIEVEATATYENPIYKIGKQELREGLPHFFVTQKCNLSGVISQLQRIE